MSEQQEEQIQETQQIDNEMAQEQSIETEIFDMM
jgi:hypothetical protein